MTQYSKSNFKALYGSSGTTFPDNTTGEISEADVRQFGEDMADSFTSKQDDVSYGTGWPETIADGASISWNLNNRMNGMARLLTSQTAIALTLTNFALGSKRTLLVQKSSASDLVITPTYGSFNFYSNDSSFNTVSTFTLRGKASSMFWVDFYNYGNSANPFGIRVEVRSHDKDVVFKNIQKTSHGYSVGDIITTSGGAYVKLSALTQVPLGIIDLVPSTNVFRIVTSGLVQGLSGLTADTMYYVQASGSLGTTVTSLPFLWAISTTAGYIVRTPSTNNSIVTDKISVSSAEILALNTTPKQLVATPGSGKMINMHNIKIVYTYGTTPYATNTTLRVLYGTTTAAFIVSQASIISLSNNAVAFIGATNSSVTIYNGPLSDFTDKALNLSVASGDPTAGDGTLDIYITYSIITV